MNEKSLEDKLFDELALAAEPYNLAVVEKNNDFLFPLIELEFFERSSYEKKGFNLMINNYFFKPKALFIYHRITSRLGSKWFNNPNHEIFLAVCDYLEKRFQKQIILESELLPYKKEVYSA